MQKLNYRKINVQSYVPGKSNIFRKKNIIKLSANESALGQSPKSRKIISSIKKLDKYPDSKTRTLRREISQKFKCNFDQIICGSGSDEVIQLLCQLFLQKKDEVIVPQYSFLMYRIYSNIIGSKVIYSKENELKVSVLWKLLLQFLFERSHFFLIHRHLLLLLSLTQRGKRIYNRLRGRVWYVDGNSDDIDLGHNLPVGRWENFK